MPPSLPVIQVMSPPSPLNVKRQLRRPRAMTLPASRLEPTPEASLGLRLPDTPAVRKQLADGGPGTTLLDVAMGIVARLYGALGSEKRELDFLQDCIQAGASKTAVPCSLLPEWKGKDDIKDSLLLLCAGAASPCSPALSSRASSRKPSSVRGLRSVGDLAAARWPGEGWAPELEALMEASFGTWSFDVFELSRLSAGRPLQIVGWESLRSLQCFSELGIDAGKAQHFLELVEFSYAREKTVPYHNNLHATDVTQLVHALLVDVGFDDYFDELGMLALILSAIIHDMGHDGRSNNFHINMQDGLALMYNDRSVLENHHVSSAFQLMSGSEEADLLSVLPREQFMQVRKEMINAVLGTDMASHFERVSSLKGHAEKLGCRADDWAAEPAALLELQTALLHAADIATPAKPGALSDSWTQRLASEFFSQGDEELRLGLPISPLCDRKAGRFAASQVGFISFIVQPTFELLAQVEEQVETTILPHLRQNLVTWEARSLTEEEGGSLGGGAPAGGA